MTEWNDPPLVFLGGTCNKSTWRNKLIRKLKIRYFNPVVDDWNSEARARELSVRQRCDICLYVLTPLMTEVYAVAEVVDDSNKRPEKTVFSFLYRDNGKRLTQGQCRSLNAVGELVRRNGGKWVEFECLPFVLNNWTRR